MKLITSFNILPITGVNTADLFNELDKHDEFNRVNSLVSYYNTRLVPMKTYKEDSIKEISGIIQSHIKRIFEGNNCIFGNFYIAYQDYTMIKVKNNKIYLLNNEDFTDCIIRGEIENCIKNTINDYFNRGILRDDNVTDNNGKLNFSEDFIFLNFSVMFSRSSIFTVIMPGELNRPNMIGMWEYIYNLANHYRNNNSYDDDEEDPPSGLWY